LTIKQSAGAEKIASGGEIMKRCVIALILLLNILLASCTNQDNGQVDIFPVMNMPLSRMNKAIKIQDSPTWGNSYKNNEHLTLQIINQTEDIIVFPSDYGLKIFGKDGQNWVAIQNNMIYPGPDKKTSST
jgi:hypothetical protein